MELIQNGAKIYDDFENITSSKKLNFSRAEWNSRLDLAFPGNSSTRKLEIDARDREMVTIIHDPVRFSVAKGMYKEKWNERLYGTHDIFSWGAFITKADFIKGQLI